MLRNRLNIEHYMQPRAIELDELERLVASLEASDTRMNAIALLHSLASQLPAEQNEGLCLTTPNFDGKPVVRLLSHPAVFLPEEWSQTFIQGLLIDPEMFDDKAIVELGSGSGWIALLLLTHTRARCVLGVDLNPFAVALAKLNTWLNGTEPDGTLKRTAYGTPFIDAFLVELSDLLREPIGRCERFDHVIGCIPQVLHPDALSKKKSDERMSTRALYDLSNYCFGEGIQEDCFGLQLVAKALEQAQLCLKPNGLVTFNIGGRPGLATISSVFHRRLYTPSFAFSRRVRQTADTDLSSFVLLEEAHGIKFEFHTTAESTDVISASEAVAYLHRGKAVFHDLFVVRAAFGLDLSSVSVEKRAFVEYFTKELLEHERIAYPDVRGGRNLRERIAKFFCARFGYAAEADALFIGPTRAQLMHIVLSMFAGKTLFLSASLSAYLTIAERHSMRLTIADAPDISIIDIATRAIIEQAQMHPTRWYVVTATLQESPLGELPANVVFLYGMDKNALYPGLELSFLLNTPESWRKPLVAGAELTYSTISRISEVYYEWFFDDVLSRTAVAGRSQAAIETTIDEHEEKALRLDYGEFVAPVPRVLIRGLIAALLTPQDESTFDDLRTSIQAYLRFTRNVDVSTERIALGNGVFPLLGAVVETLARRLGRSPRVAVPCGTYGMIYPMIVHHGGTVITVQVDEKTAFVPTIEDITNIAENPDLLWLTQPNNPSGCFFTADAVAAIMHVCAEREIVVLADEIFFLLSDTKLGAWTPPTLSFLGCHQQNAWLFVADGVSKAFAAGGLRAGFVVCPNTEWASAIQSCAAMPPAYVLRACATLYGVFARSDETPFAEVAHYVSDARTRLDEQRAAFLALLRMHGVGDMLDDDAKRGGLFVLARLGDDGAARLANEARVLVNAPMWSRTRGWCRVCCVEKSARFDTALERLRVFLGESYPRS